MVQAGRDEPACDKRLGIQHGEVVDRLGYAFVNHRRNSGFVGDLAKRHLSLCKQRLDGLPFAWKLGSDVLGESF